MNVDRTPPLRQDDRGFTLVEMLVTMTLAVVVLFAVLQGADLFRSSTEASSRRTDTQEQLRRTLRTMVTELRQAPTPSNATTPLANVGGATVSSSDLIVHTAQGWSRYCAVAGEEGTATQDTATLYHSRSASLPTEECGTGNPTVLVRDALRESDRLFTYTARADLTSDGCAVDSTTPCLPSAAEVRGVGIRLAVAPGPTSTPLVTTGAVSLRNRNP